LQLARPPETPVGQYTIVNIGENLERKQLTCEIPIFKVNLEFAWMCISVLSFHDERELAGEWLGVNSYK